MPHYSWRTPRRRPIVLDAPLTYTGDARPLTHARTYEWIHPISEIVTALMQAGLTLDWLNEHELLPYRLFPMMVPTESRGLFRLPDNQPRLALAFSQGLQAGLSPGISRPALFD